LVAFSDLIIEEIEQKDYEKSHQYAEYLQISANELLSLTTNLLNWSRAQTDGITFNQENLNLKVLIDNNINLLRNLSEKKGIILTSTLENDLFIFADNNMVLSILRNLITNAIKFSRKDDRITIMVEEADNEVIVHISDTGVGIDENKIDKLFKIGENVKSAGTAEEPGTGLGLILCKEFIDKHNGKLWVESEKGKGSRFSFTLPKIIKKN
jgi:signal transduction histidine kinase